MNKLRLFTFYFLITNFCLVTFSYAQQPWQMFHKDNKRSGYANVQGPQTANLKWKHYIDNAGGGPNSIAISSFGTIYVGSHDSITALDLNGHRKWAKHYSGVEGPALSNDGKIIYFPSLQSVVALDTNGTQLWQTPLGDTAIFGVCVSTDGNTIYQGSWDKKVYALNANNGSVKWTYLTKGSVSYPVTIDDKDSLVLVGGGDSHRIPDSLVYALSPSAGTLKWKFNTHHTRSGSPCVGPDDLIYVPSEPQLMVLNPTGTLNWFVGGPNDSAGIITPVVTPDTTICLGTSTGYMMEFNGKTHHTKWTYLTGPEPLITPPFYGMIGFPVVDNTGTLYEGSVDYNMYAMDKNGNVKWKYLTAGVISEASPALGTDGTLYFSSGDGYLYAVRDSNATTGIISSDKNNNLQIYPNPSNGIFTIQSSEKISSIEITNLIGEKVYEAPLHLSPKGESAVSLPSGLEQGIYFLHITSDKGVATKKIILNK